MGPPDHHLVAGVVGHDQAGPGQGLPYGVDLPFRGHPGRFDQKIPVIEVDPLPRLQTGRIQVGGHGDDQAAGTDGNQDPGLLPAAAGVEKGGLDLHEDGLGQLPFLHAGQGGLHLGELVAGPHQGLAEKLVLFLQIVPGLLGARSPAPFLVRFPPHCLIHPLAACPGFLVIHGTSLLRCQPDQSI